MPRCGVDFHTRKDQVIFEKDEVLTGAGTLFSVFTPYKNAWLKKLAPFYVKSYPVQKYASRLAPAPSALPSLQDLGFEQTGLSLKGGMAAGRALFADFKRRIAAYGGRRDYPALKGPSYLSVHLRFGTVSIRELVRYALQQGSEGAAVWLSELAWRDFYFMVLAARPDVAEGAFKKEFNALKFDGDERDWQAWCAGNTGYPLVDAAMRQLNQTGYMHNRLRMVAASFLVKDLGIDWRRGERYFARAAERLRPRGQQRRLAVGGLHRLRRAAVFPHLQSGDAVRALRCGRRIHPPVRARTRARRRQGHPRALAAGCAGAGARRLRHRPRLPGADRGPRDGAQADPGALRGRQKAVGLKGSPDKESAMATAIDTGIPAKHRAAIAQGLSRLLADTYVLYLKTHGFHWNVEGPMFQTLHLMFMDQYTEAWNAIDPIAERIRALGHYAPGSYSQYMKLATVKEAAGVPKAREDGRRADRRTGSGGAHRALGAAAGGGRQRPADARPAHAAPEHPREERLDAQEPAQEVTSA